MIKHLLLVTIVTTVVACDAGPLPAPASSPRAADTGRDYQKDWFPTTSDVPLPLDKAILADKPAEVAKLLEQGADPNARWLYSGARLPLQDVLESRRFGYTIADPTEMVRLLLKYGADPNAKWCPYESRSTDPGSCKSARGFTALMAAAGLGMADAVAMLLEAGADASVRAWGGESALDLATSEIGFELISRALFPEIATRDQNALDSLRDDTVNPIRSDATMFALSIERAAWFSPPPPPPPPPSFKDTADSESVGRNHHRSLENRVIERFRTLLRIGADVNHRSAAQLDHSTALGNAMSWHFFRAARLLLDAGADVNQRECFQSGFDMSERKPIYEPACTRDNGVTVLMSSARRGNREAVALLLEFKADRSLEDWAGRSALDYAKTDEIKALLTTARPPRSR